LFSAVAILVSFWNYNGLENFLVAKLYRLEKPDAKQKVYANNDDKFDAFSVSLFGGLRDAICDTLPSCLQCCRSSRNERGLQMGRDKMEKETNIVNILQSRRYMNAAFK